MVGWLVGWLAVSCFDLHLEEAAALTEVEVGQAAREDEAVDRVEEAAQLRVGRVVADRDDARARRLEPLDEAGSDVGAAGAVVAPLREDADDGLGRGEGRVPPGRRRGLVGSDGAHGRVLHRVQRARCDDFLPLRALHRVVRQRARRSCA